MNDCIKNSEPQCDLKLSPEAQLKVKAALDALPKEHRDKIKAVLITGDRTPEEIEAHLAALSPEDRETVIVVEAEEPRPENHLHIGTMGRRPMGATMMMAAMAMSCEWQCPDIRLPAGPNTNRHCTGRRVEGSCCAKGYKAPEKVARNAECPCGSGRKYKHCKLKGLC